MPMNKPGLITRRTLLKSTAAASAALAVGTGGVPLVNIRRAYAQNLPNPADVLAKINVGNYVKADYRKQYNLGDDELLWDPKKDWIRTADWEGIRKEHAGLKSEQSELNKLLKSDEAQWGRISAEMPAARALSTKRK